MRYTLTFLESQYAELHSSSTKIGGQSGQPTCFVACRRPSVNCGFSSGGLSPFLMPNYWNSPPGGYVPARSFLAAMKQADLQQSAFVLVHSHPADMPNHSDQDDREEPALFRTAYNRISTPEAVHASLVLSDPKVPRGRVWLDGNGIQPIEVVRVIGRRFRFYFRDSADLAIDTSFFDREVRAFGPDLLPLLQRLTVGVIGAGGTGSAVVELLIRLGIGHLIVADSQALDRSNVSRVFGSTVGDVGMSKVRLMGRQSETIGLGTQLEPIEKDATYASAMKRFRDCDAVFGCTDDQWGRSILTQFAIQYCLPVLDLGAKIDSANGVIRAIPGRITMLMPGLPCLFCRRQITPEGVSAEIMESLAPQEAAQRRREGYIPELPGAEPAVIAFTAGTAAFAMAELLHRLTGYKGEEYSIGENIIRFDESTIRKPGAAAIPGCFCADQSLVGRGDRKRFLDQTWRPE